MPTSVREYSRFLTITVVRLLSQFRRAAHRDLYPTPVSLSRHEFVGVLHSHHHCCGTKRDHMDGVIAEVGGCASRRGKPLSIRLVYEDRGLQVGHPTRRVLSAGHGFFPHDSFSVRVRTLTSSNTCTQIVSAPSSGLLELLSQCPSEGSEETSA